MNTCNGCNNVNGLCDRGCTSGWKGYFCEERNGRGHFLQTFDICHWHVFDQNTMYTNENKFSFKTVDYIFSIINILICWRFETMDINYCRSYWYSLPLVYHHWNIIYIYCGYKVNIVFILCNYADMLSIEKTTVIFYFIEWNLTSRRRKPKQSQTVDVQEPQCDDRPNVSNSDVTRTEYQELRDHKPQIYERLS